MLCFSAVSHYKQENRDMLKRPLSVLLERWTQRHQRAEHLRQERQSLSQSTETGWCSDTQKILTASQANTFDANILKERVVLTKLYFLSCNQMCTLLCVHKIIQAITGAHISSLRKLEVLTR